MGELGGERIDIIEWSEDTVAYIKEALNPATVLEVELDEAGHRAKVTVSEDQQSLAIGRGGQNVRLAAKLTGWNIDIESTRGDNVGSAANNDISFDKEAAEDATTAIEADLEAQEENIENDPAVEAGVTQDSDSIITSEADATEADGARTVGDETRLSDDGTPVNDDDRDVTTDSKVQNQS
jgi:N utilization substance protein A